MTEMNQGAQSGPGALFRKGGGVPDAERTDPRGPSTVEGPTVANPVVGPDAEREVLSGMRERQHQRFGGSKLGSAFFGWLVAVGMTVLLTALVALVAGAAGVGPALDPAGADASAIGLAGAVVQLAALALAYFTGGYVAGRLARFDGTRNGVLSWVVGAVMTVLLSLVGAFAGSQMDLAGRLALPSVQADAGALTVGGIVVLVVALLLTLVTAALGGRLGERFHNRVDRSGISRRR